MSKFKNFFLKNKISILILSLILALFYIIYGDINKNSLNVALLDYDIKNPYILVTEGSAIIKRDKIIKLSKSQKEDIFKMDKIRTLSKSTATIFWSDGSITRIGERTSIDINELNFNKSTNKSSVKFDIGGGKSWSNVVRYLDSGSEFIETYDNARLAATVRGTVFEINVDKNYVHAVNHSIVISDTDTNKNYDIPEGKIRRNSGNMDFLSNTVLENAWVNWNNNEDVIYINGLLKDWQNKINISLRDHIDLKKAINEIIEGKTDNLNGVKDALDSFKMKDENDLNKAFLNIYQNVSSLPNSSNIALIKANLRNEIINSAKNKDKQKYIQDFLRLNIFDYLDSVNKNLSGAQGKLKGYINSYANRTIDKKYLNNLLNSFDKDRLKQINDILESLNAPAKNILNKLKDPNLKNNIKDASMQKISDINDQINGAKEDLQDKISNFFNR